MPKRTIFVDADACPKVIKDILFRAATRTKTLTILVANQYLLIPKSDFIQFIKVGAGFDVADNEIVLRCNAHDLIITADIPLADAVIKKGATALNPRGELYTTDNISQRLSMRNLMEQLRDAGQISGGPNTLGKKDRQLFANQLDRWLADV